MSIKIKSVSMPVGIYDSQSTITRHLNGDVTVNVPYLKWVGQTGVLDFEKLRFGATDERTDILKNEIFTEDGCEEYASLAEFLVYCCEDMGY